MSRTNPDISRWFKINRELYEWPLGRGRQISEEFINRLCIDTQHAIATEDKNALQSVFVKIHRWKTDNRQDQSSKYCSMLERRGIPYLDRFFDFIPFTDTNNLGAVIVNLKIDHCNLPVCTAITSFLYNRDKVPILDKFLSLFFTRQLKQSQLNETTKQVLNYVKRINFKLETDGIGGLRLAVYNDSNFKYNTNMYLTEFVPECIRISNDLNAEGCKYSNINGEEVDFRPIDVEMAIFSWSVKNSSYFKGTMRGKSFFRYY